MHSLPNIFIRKTSSYISLILAATWCLWILPGKIAASPVDVECPAGSSLDACVAQACQNADGGKVLLQAGVYDANVKSAINNNNTGAGLCPGGVSVYGKGPNKTFLVSQGPNRLNANVSLQWALAIGSPFGEMSGHVEIRDLTIRCDAPGLCPNFAASVINAASAVVSNITVEGFTRGIQGSSSNLVITNNTLRGMGADNFNGRGIFAVGANSTKENVEISENDLHDYWRGLVADTLLNTTIAKNSFSEVAQGIFAQNLDGDLTISENIIHSSDLGIFLGLALAVFDPELGDFVVTGSTADPMVLDNLIPGSTTGIGVSFAPGFGTVLTVDGNKIVGTESALQIDPDLTPPNLPPPPPSDPTYDPCLHRVVWDDNFIRPKAAIPMLDSATCGE